MAKPSNSSTSPSDDGRYRLLVDAITDYAIYMLDPTGRVTSWNPGARRFKGYEAAEIIGQSFTRFYSQADQEAGVPQRALATAAATGRFESEGWRVRKDGGRFWAHVVIDAIRDPTGQLIGFAKITCDLTERKIAQESLKRSEEQFRLLVQGVTDYAIYMLDRGGLVSSWNAGAQRIKGYLPDEIIGEHFSAFYTEHDRAAGEPQAALATAAAEGRFEKEGWRVRKDGARFWAHVVIDAIRDEEGAVIGYAKITRDITERRDAQRALDQARQALLQSQKLDAIGQLTGGVAHDFNNLLMAVMGSLELLKKRLPEDPKALALLENAVHGAQRGAALTQRMLAFARKQDLKLEGVDLPALVGGMTGLLERSLGPDIELTSRFPPGLPPVLTDANQLETVLLNLVVNARDAMPEGGRITIKAAEQTLGPASEVGLPAGAYVRLAVTDTGTGMDEDTLARAAEPFYTTKGVGKGTGLGLPMVYGLAEQSGGRLVLNSRPGHGTQVELWLRRADALAPPGAPETPPSAEDAWSRSLVVLAVDDDGLVLMNTVAMLEDLGHRAIPVCSGFEALQALGEHPVDLVITDHAMPQMTGLQLLEEIRARHPDLPIVLATGYAELPPGAGEDVPRLAKPYSQAQLARLLRGLTRARDPA
ncbi:PAS domain-containing sensor histidine kinase [Phenylobacterium sp.]|uniref:hybrid sensor histidine kinase/response regulator n=1 Tax=Phenylobacterium sp. TaxID=1871053 RepID=UPI0027177C55|nr:PAS domain-containing sensor histidine kinase [Phenylobacterium sp.]MDO8381065.1 PAS domain S-box protein [Phenylobacterium sp.]